MGSSSNILPSLARSFACQPRCAATNVVFVNSTKLTAKTPAHAGGAVSVTVTNPNHAFATLNNGYTYVPVQFDANGDHVIDPSDIFYLVNYLFLGGAETTLNLDDLLTDYAEFRRLHGSAQVQP